MDLSADLVRDDAVALDGGSPARKPVPESCDCNPTLDGECGDDSDKVKKAANRALEMALAAKNRLAAFAKAPSDPKNKKIADALRKHFRWSPPATGKDAILETVIDGVDAVVRGLRGGPICPGCPKSPPPNIPPKEVTKVSAYTRLEYNSTNCFNVLPLFLKEPPDTAASDVVHEFAHNWIPTTDGGGYLGESNYPGALASIAVNNADSYSNFVRDVQ